MCKKMHQPKIRRTSLKTVEIIFQFFLLIISEFMNILNYEFRINFDRKKDMNSSKTNKKILCIQN